MHDNRLTSEILPQWKSIETTASCILSPITFNVTNPPPQCVYLFSEFKTGTKKIICCNNSRKGKKGNPSCNNIKNNFINQFETETRAAKLVFLATMNCDAEFHWQPRRRLQRANSSEGEPTFDKSVKEVDIPCSISSEIRQRGIVLVSNDVLKVNLPA